MLSTRYFLPSILLVFSLAAEKSLLRNLLFLRSVKLKAPRSSLLAKRKLSSRRMIPERLWM